MINKSDNTKGWHKVMTKSDDKKCCSKAMTINDTKWWNKMILQSDDKKVMKHSDESKNDTNWLLKVIKQFDDPDDDTRLWIKVMTNVDDSKWLPKFNENW